MFETRMILLLTDGLLQVSIDETEKCLSRNASPPHQETTLQEGLLNLTVAQVVMIFFTLTAVTATSAMSVGLVTIGIPKIAEDLQIPQSLILWSAYPNSSPSPRNVAPNSFLGQARYIREHDWPRT